MLTRTNEIGERIPVDFRLFLQNELVSRCKRNLKFSLRSFAKQLEMNPGTLSQILKGQRKITRKTFLKLSQKLSLTPQQVRMFKPSTEDLVSLSDLEMNFQNVAEDVFEMISDWYHYAILELSQVEHFRNTPKWIARALNITPHEANTAIERLIRLGFIKIGKSGQWHVENNSNAHPRSEMTTVALRKLQRQVLEKAILALEEIPVSERDQSSVTLAFDTNQLKEAIDLLTKFRRRFCERFEKADGYKRVYNLSLSFYPVSKKLNLEAQK